MLNRVRYFSETERVKLLEEYKNMYLIREENIIDGDFLVFSDVKPNHEMPKEFTPEELKIQELEFQVEGLQSAMAELTMMMTP